MIKDITEPFNTAFCLELSTQYAEKQIRRTTGKFRARAFNGQFVTKKLIIKGDKSVDLDNKVRMLVVNVRKGDGVYLYYQHGPEGFENSYTMPITKLAVIDCELIQPYLRLNPRSDEEAQVEVEVQYLCDDTAKIEF